MIQFVVTREEVYGLEKSVFNFVKSEMKKYGLTLELTEEAYQKLKAKKKMYQEQIKVSVDKEDFIEYIINYYRTLLIHPPPRNSGEAENIGRMLYDLLVKPLSDHIKNKKEILIIPDGILNFLPFETLIDENRKYLVESYHIRYTHSMSVLELIENRRYSDNRRPLIAFGGAVYDEVRCKVDMVENEAQLAFLKKKIYSANLNKNSVRDVYAALRVSRWVNLPGTLHEVNAIAKIVKDSEKVIGEDVTEDKIKALSQGGELSNYKVIHFATHGFIMPALPELSALVLSQFEKERGNEDGYLRIGEIAELHINADFVNLSACETSLGKIYGGEGVVGLTQAFLVAGANGVSASLWQVDDESTCQFMTAIYRCVEEKQVGYAEAITQTKRLFIRGDFGELYQAPFYWAPFVYYGK